MLISRFVTKRDTAVFFHHTTDSFSVQSGKGRDRKLSIKNAESLRIFLFCLLLPVRNSAQKIKILKECVIVAQFGATFGAFWGIDERENFEKLSR